MNIVANQEELLKSLRAKTDEARSLRQQLAKANELVMDMTESQNRAVHRAYKAEQSLAKANERVKELLAYMHDAQKWFDKHDPNGRLQSSHPEAIKELNKFAIEKQLETANKCAFGSAEWVLEHIKFLKEQLRKE